MNFFTKTKFLVAVIIVLSAIILAIFGTIGFHYFRYDRSSDDRSLNEKPKESKQMGKYMAKELKLTPEQVIQIDTLRERFHKASSDLVKESKNISKDIMEEITSEKPNIDKLKELAQKFGKLQEEQKQIMINHLLEVRNSCTPAQQMHFRKFVRQMEKHDQMRRNRNGEGKRKN